jgi:hypothetical protein
MCHRPVHPKPPPIRNLDVVGVANRPPEGFRIAFFLLIANSDISNVVGGDVKSILVRRLGYPRHKELSAVRNFVASMVGLVRSADYGLENQCLVDSFKVDEGRSIGLGIYRDPLATKESGEITIAHSRAVEATDTVEERRDSHSMRDGRSIELPVANNALQYERSFDIHTVGLESWRVEQCTPDIVIIRVHAKGSAAVPTTNLLLILAIDCAMRRTKLGDFERARTKHACSQTNTRVLNHVPFR